MYGVATVVMITVFECYKNDIFLSIYVGTGISLTAIHKNNNKKNKNNLTIK